MRKVFRAIAIFALLAVIGLSGLKLWEISAQTADESTVKKEVSVFRPQMPEVLFTGSQTGDSDVGNVAVPEQEEPESEPESEPVSQINQGIIDMQNEVNPDIKGWLTIPNTQIDYPFVIAADNDYYLRRNIYGKKATAGSLFIDYRNSPDFTDFNTVIYGHNMRNLSMFGELKLFANMDFFLENTTGVIFLEDKTLTLEIFAYMIVKANDSVIYDIYPGHNQFYDYVSANAGNYREPSARGQVVTLSTCSYQSDSARAVLLATIV